MKSLMMNTGGGISFAWWCPGQGQGDGEAVREGCASAAPLAC